MSNSRLQNLKYFLIHNSRFHKIFIIFLLSIPLIALSIFAIRFFTEPSVVPENPTVTNITDQGFTLSWTTKDTTTTGSVYVLENTDFVPILSRFTAKKYYDTRDELVVNWYGQYDRQRLFTHFVDVTGLKPQTKYSFRIQTGNYLYDVSEITGSSNVATLKTPDTNVTPSPIYGRIMRADEINPQMGAIVYLTAIDSTGTYSSEISTVTNTNGSYTLDLTSLKDNNADIFKVDDKSILSFSIDSGNRGKKTYLKKNIDTDPIENIVIQNETKDNVPVVSLGDNLNETLTPIATKLESFNSNVNAESLTNISKSFDDISSYPEIRILKTIFFPILIIIFLSYIILTWKKITQKILDNRIKINRVFSIFLILVMIFQLTTPIAVYARTESSNTNSESLFSQVANFLQKAFGSGLVEKVNAADACGLDGKSLCNALGECFANCANFSTSSKTSTLTPTQYSCGPLGGYCGRGGTCTPGGCVGETPLPTTSSPSPQYSSCGQVGGSCGRSGTCTPDGCKGETPIPDCSNGETKCKDTKTVQKCSEGKWNNFETCDGSSQRCGSGSCVGANTCVTEDINMGCEITNGIYTGKYKINHKKTDCSASIEVKEDLVKCPVSTTGYEKVCSATTKAGECVSGTSNKKMYDVKPDCSVSERTEYDPTCLNSSYSPDTKTQTDTKKGAKKVIASIAKVSATDIEAAKNASSSNPLTSGSCSQSDLGTEYDSGGSCYKCITIGKAVKISQKSCEGSSTTSSFACGSDVTLGIGYRFSKDGKCYRCIMPNSSATEVSCNSQEGDKVPESKLAGNVNCSDLDNAGLTGSLANQKCVTGIDREGNLTFRTSAIVDKDGDGFTSEIDCDDSDLSVHPGASDTATEDKSCDGKITFTYQKINTGCSSAYKCEEGLICALKTSQGGNDEYICQKSINKALSDDITTALENGTEGWEKILKGYISGSFKNFAKACPDAANPQDCNANGIPDVLEEAYGINTTASGDEFQKIIDEAIKKGCEKQYGNTVYGSGQVEQCKVDARTFVESSSTINKDDSINYYSQ
ncbi:MAG: fibronectin type III domain-containing protein, partial [bacterium]